MKPLKGNYKLYISVLSHENKYAVHVWNYEVYLILQITTDLWLLSS